MKSDKKFIPPHLRFKPCPFCGWKDMVYGSEFQKGPPYWIECPGCYSRGPMADIRWEAQFLWNHGFVGRRDK